MTAPAQKERAQRAARVMFDFSALDHIGHGVKVADPMKDVGRGIKSQPSPAEVKFVALTVGYLQKSGSRNFREGFPYHSQWSIERKV